MTQQPADRPEGAGPSTPATPAAAGGPVGADERRKVGPINWVSVLLRICLGLLIVAIFGAAVTYFALSRAGNGLALVVSADDFPQVDGPIEVSASVGQWIGTWSDPAAASGECTVVDASGADLGPGEFVGFQDIRINGEEYWSDHYWVAGVDGVYTVSCTEPSKRTGIAYPNGEYPPGYEARTELLSLVGVTGIISVGGLIPVAALLLLSLILSLVRARPAPASRADRALWRRIAAGIVLGVMGLVYIGVLGVGIVVGFASGYVEPSDFLEPGWLPLLGIVALGLVCSVAAVLLLRSAATTTRAARASAVTSGT